MKLIRYIVYTFLLSVLTLSFTPRLQADSLMVYFEPTGFGTFRIETSPNWQQYNLVINNILDSTITAIYFKPFVDEEVMNDKGFNISFELDDLSFSGGEIFTFDDSATSRWSGINNNDAVFKVLENENTPDDSGFSVRLVYRHSDLTVYPDIAFKFSLPDSGFRISQSCSLKFSIKSGMNTDEFKSLIPLQIGNKWFYRHLNFWDDGAFTIVSEDYKFRQTIIDTVTMPDGNLYYIRKYENLNSGATSTDRLRYDDQGYLILNNGGDNRRLNADFVDSRHAVLVVVIDNSGSWPETTKDGFQDEFRKTGIGNRETLQRTKFHRWDDGSDDSSVNTIIQFGIGLKYSGDSWSWSSGSYGRHFTDFLAAEIDGIIYGDSSLLVSIYPEEINYILNDYNLSNNYPNPFNPVTTIEYTLPRSGEVSLIIYNILGKEVARLVDGEMTAGNHTANWDASNFASGIYFYRLKSGNFVQTRKMVLLK